MGLGMAARRLERPQCKDKKRGHLQAKRRETFQGIEINFGKLMIVLNAMSHITSLSVTLGLGRIPITIVSTTPISKSKEWLFLSHIVQTV